MDVIDLRSDTVTQPTPAMRAAMAAALVGDDVYGEDPTINRLQDEAAAMLGKEAGLFVVSGTMGNLTSVLSHCGRGDEMILGKDSHIFKYEAGGAAAYGGVQPHTIRVLDDGTFDLDELRGAIRPDNPHTPVSRLVCIENTQSFRMGAPLPPSFIADVARIAHDHDLRVHIDGARLFNAATALGVPAAELVRDADSVSICLSKGLSAPVGSVIVGSRSFIARAHRIRKSLGGGMRQAGILAAAGLIALRDMTKRLADDHATAHVLARGLADIPYIQIDVEKVQTNILFFKLADDAPYTPEQLSARLKAEHNILIRPYLQAGTNFRLVTHCWFTPEHVERVLDALHTLLDGVGTRAGYERLASD
jgi:threonine aldolase